MIRHCADDNVIRLGPESSAGPQRAVQVERSADQCKVRETLREVSQGLAAMTSLFRVEANMVGKAEHPLENQSRFLEPRPIVATGSGQSLDQRSSWLMLATNCDLCSLASASCLFLSWISSNSRTFSIAITA
jgi:hypothetical protein